MPAAAWCCPTTSASAAAAGLDPCAALSTALDLAAGESAERVFLLGYADSPPAARKLAAEAAATPAAQRLDAVRAAGTRCWAPPP
jgi:cyclic beta-1,2-glucan synthetase